MLRMMLGSFVSVAGPTVPLTHTELVEIQALYASGEGGGIAFAPVQLDSGVFRGVREHGELVAVAGVHVLSRAQGVAAVGNVFVRADVRGRGLAQTALSATVAAVLGTGVETIGLNVERSNVAAIRAYENLGFREALRYVEGTADRAAPPGSLADEPARVRGLHIDPGTRDSLSNQAEDWAS
jgi:RimJ/RimL family protein N-acetyltransferase